MNRYAVLALAACALLSSCHDKQKADNETVLLTAGVLAHRVGELEVKVLQLEDRIETLEKGRGG